LKGTSSGCSSSTARRSRQASTIPLFWSFTHVCKLLQVFGLIPLVLETYAVYSVITYFLRQLVNRTPTIEL
jgi:hypothetical protein